MRGFLYCIAGLALAVAALCVPVRLVLRGAVEAPGGRLRLTLCYLVLKKRFLFDLYLLNTPALTMYRRLKGGAVKEIPLTGGHEKMPGLLQLLRSALRVKALHLHWQVGVRGDPAATAMLCGALEHICRLIRETFFAGKLLEAARITAEPCFQADMLRLEVRGIAEVFPAQIILKTLIKKREKNRNGSSD